MVDVESEIVSDDVESVVLVGAELVDGEEVSTTDEVEDD